MQQVVVQAVLDKDRRQLQMEVRPTVQQVLMVLLFRLLSVLAMALVVAVEIDIQLQLLVTQLVQVEQVA
jgi:hypothetical protein